MSTKSIKKCFILIIVVLLLLVIVGFAYLSSSPTMRFFLIMNDISPAIGVTKNEVIFEYNGNKSKMMVYKRIFGKKNKYYFILHGLTPQGYNHPALVKLSKAIAYATGRTVMVPYIEGSTTSRDVIDVINGVTNMYMNLFKKYQGDYHACGACISATFLLAALKDVPPDIYPKKVFLYGPFLNGKQLVNFYNNSGMQIDFIVKLANAMRHKSITQKEKALISKAIKMTKPGVTDVEMIKNVLGDKLFKKVDSLKIDNPAFEKINKLLIFNKNHKFIKSKFYILHSKSDNIIPYTMGLSLHNYLKQLGLKTRFLATNSFMHTKQQGLKAMMNEFNNLKIFFDDLFNDE